MRYEQNKMLCWMQELWTMLYSFPKLMSHSLMGYEKSKKLSFG
jgi:hypothetical protein